MSDQSPKRRGASRRSIREDVLKRLKQMIITGEIGPGADISELKLSKQLGVGRTPVREALMQLCGEGLIRSSANRGFWMPSMNPDDIRDAYETRELIEIRAVERLCGQPLDGRADELAAIVDMFQDLPSGSPHRVRMHNVEVDRRFHFSLVTMSGNRHFQRIWRSSEFVRSVARLVRQGDSERVELVTLPNGTDRDVHMAVVDALRQSDCREAVELLRQHIRRGCDALIRACCELRLDDLYWA